MKKQILYLRLFTTTALLFSGSALYSQKTVQYRIRKDILYLASDKLEGRKAGCPGADSAAIFIAGEFKNAGLKSFSKSFLQDFEMSTGLIKGENNSLLINGIIYKLNKDFTPLSFSTNGSLEAEVVFAGYGRIKLKDTLGTDDFKGEDITGKWVMLLAGSSAKAESYKSSLERNKALDAKDKGAAGVLILSFKNNLPSEDEERSGSSSGIPVIYLDSNLTSFILKTAEINSDSLDKQIKEGKKFNSKAVPFKVKANVMLTEKMAKISNVIGYIEGSDTVLKKQYIVIGGHYDHLGMGGPNSGSRTPDVKAVHYGADDNASGTSAVIEMAYLLKQNIIKPRRSVIFVAFTAEEEGLVGSKYFIKNPPVPLKNIDAFINFDMIGRLNNKTNGLVIGGSGTSAESEKIIKACKSYKLNIKLNPDGFGPSDHASFYISNIPVFFMTTGAHDDYHTPRDVASKINYKGMMNIIDFSEELIMNIVNRDSMLTYRESGPKKDENAQVSYKVTLGILPDVTGTSNDGLRVDGVRKDGPAERGGIKKGDVIVKMNGKPVKNIYEYMHRLNQLDPGQTVTVDVLRNGKKVVLLIQL